MDIRQSEMYADYMKKIGWVVEKIDTAQIFIKKFPIVGAFIKIQRPDRVPSIKFINQVAKKYRARSVSLEMINDKRLMMNDFKINDNPYLPTKTIQIDLTPGEEKIFQRFTEAKRRAVRRAVKNNVIVKESKDIKEFIKLKAKDFWPLGWLGAKDIQALFESFSPKNATVLIAYKKDSGQARMTAVAGVLLLFYDGMAYYWMAASTSEGKKLAAPTLLVWEALQLSKKRKCKLFDFEGIYDERFHNATKKWQGFTKFKEGFGGREVSFPKPLTLRITF